MTRAQGSSTDLAYLTEVTPGVTPAGTPQAIRKNTDTIGGTNGNIESGEIRSDGEISSDIQGNKNVLGDVVTELSATSHDELLKSLMFDDWTSVTTGAIALDAVASGNTFTRASGSFLTDGFVIGQWVLSSAFTTAANNGWFKVTAVVALTLTVVGSTLVDESGGGDELIASKYMKGSTTATYLSIFKRWTDIDKEIIFAGCLINSMAVTIAPEQVIGITFTANGRTEATPSAVGTTSASVSSADPMTSFSGIVLLNDVINTNITAFDFTLTNNLTDGFVVGNRTKVDQFKGRRQTTGSISFFFENTVEYEASNDHTAKDLALSMNEGSDYYGYTFPRSFYDLPTPPTEGEGAIIMSGPFRAKLDSVTSASIIVSRSL